MSEITLTLPDLDPAHVMAVLGGVSTFQMRALAARDHEKVTAAGETMLVLAEENPEAVRETFLENRDVFKVAQMPDEVLETLDLELVDGQLCRPDGDDGWTEVGIE